jgi:hypothetical protein
MAGAAETVDEQRGSSSFVSLKPQTLVRRNPLADAAGRRRENRELRARRKRDKAISQTLRLHYTTVHDAPPGESEE